MSLGRVKKGSACGIVLRCRVDKGETLEWMDRKDTLKEKER